MDIQFLSFDEIVEINRLYIERFGGEFTGTDNLRSPGSLDFALETIQGTIFGFTPYPTLVDKVAFLCHRIADGHLFRDGNKRTAFEVSILMLSINGHEIPVEILQEMIIMMADNQIFFPMDEAIEYFHSYVIPQMTP